MADFPTLHKFPEGSANRHYFVFEKLPDDSAVWRGCVLGMESVELKLQILARESNNKFFALNLGGRFQSIFRPLNRLNPRDNNRALG
jgi:hypothetical protein